MTGNIRHLLLPTGRTVHRGTLLGLAEQRRVRVCAPEMLAGVRQLETPAKRVAAVKLHPALIVQTVLILDLISDHRIVDCLREVHSNTTNFLNFSLINIIRSASQTFLSYHD